MSVLDKTIPVPNDELHAPPPEFVRLPKDWYGATFLGAERIDSEKSDWVGMRAEFGELTTLDGSPTLEVNGVTVDLSQRYSKNVSYTLEMPSKPEVEEYSIRDLTELADSLGIAVDTGDGKALPSADSLDEFVELFAAMAGTPVQVYIKQQLRKRNKVVERDDDGKPIRDENIVRVRPTQ